MRPRFGSDAKNAVFTSGECAMRERDAAAFGGVAPALDPDRHELGRAFAVADDRLRELGRHRRQRGAHRREARIVARAIGAIGALPVAAITKLSLVDVSPSIVAQLNETSAISRVSRREQTARRSARRWR